MRDPTLEDYATMTTLVEAVAQDFLERGEARSLPELNCGLCVDVADEIERRITGTPLAALPVAVLQFEDFCIDPEDDSDTPGDIRLEAVAHYPGFEPPPGVTWDDLNRWRFGESTVHAWIMVGDRHYDAETSQGVTNPFDLPCLRCLLLATVESQDAPLLARLESEHGWWRESLEIAGSRDVILGIGGASPAP